MFIAILFIFGLAAGSFINALVWRLHEQEKGQGAQKLSIFHGRSICPHCKRELAVRDLLPVISWLSLKGRCRYCQQSISIQYPVVELTMAVVFVLSYILWPFDLVAAGQKTLFITWLVCSIGLLALLVYDYKWLLLPNRIIYPTLTVALTGRLVHLAFFTDSKGHELLLLFFSLLITSGLFWILFEVSRGRWIGFGDVRLGLITGTLLANPGLSVLMIFLASVLGLLAFVIGLFGGVKTLGQKIPYGPFLIIASWLSLLFGQNLIDWYMRLFG